VAAVDQCPKPSTQAERGPLLGIEAPQLKHAEGAHGHACGMAFAAVAIDDRRHSDRR
jgi:hypothetical protein